jgi:hypothetical protein
MQPTSRRQLPFDALFFLFLCFQIPCFGQGTAFTYQGQLNRAGAPASGLYDLQFAIYDSPAAGTQLGDIVTNSATQVRNGIFMVTLDFGNQFPGDARWLEIGVRTNGGTGFTVLSPRQALTATPYAVEAGSAGSVAATNVSGTLDPAQLPAQVPLLGQNNVFAGASNVFQGQLAAAGLSSPPTLPAAALGGVAVGNGPSSVAISGSYAYVGNYNSKTLQIVDISNPASPALLGVVTTAGNPIAVAVAGRYVYLEYQFSTSLDVIDVSNPANPVTVGVVPTGNFPQAIAVSGRYAYVANRGASTLMTVDISSPTNPVVLATVATDSSPESVAIAGRYVYMASYNPGTLNVFDVNSPASPVKVSSTAGHAGAFAVAVAGRYAYVACAGSSMLDVFDVNSAALPVLVGSVATGNNPQSIAVAGRYVYVANTSGNTLQVFDVTTPSSPVSLGSVPTDPGPVSLGVAGKYVYVVNTSGGTMQTFDLGGASLQHLEAGALKTGTLQTSDTATIGNNLDVRGGVTVSGSSRFVGSVTSDDLNVRGGLTVSGNTRFTGSVTGNGGGLTNLAANQLTGTIAAARLPGNLLTNGASGVSLSGNFNGSFNGNGLGLTNLNLNSLLQQIGTAIAWGNDINGQIDVPTGITDAVALAGSFYGSVALNRNGTVVTWGNTPSAPPGLTNVVGIAAGFAHVLALKGDGTVTEWGDDTYGQIDIPAGLSGVQAIAAGYNHSLALRNDGTILAWGKNDSQQTNVPGGLSNVAAVAAGDLVSMALCSDGTVVVWGGNNTGQTNIPPGVTNVVAIACGSGHCLALRSDGTLVAWGANNFGQATVPSGLGFIKAIAAGGYHSLAVQGDGTVASWGWNNFGQGTVPGDLNNVVAVAAGGYHSLALRLQAGAVQLPVLTQNNVFLGPTNVFQGQIVAAGFSGDASHLLNLPASQLTGTVPLARLPATVVLNGASGITLSGTFNGPSGAFTPLIGGSSGNFTASTQTGYYVKSGNLVYFEIWVTWTSKGSASGSLSISLPFTVVSPRGVFHVGFVNGITFARQLVPLASSGVSTMNLYDLSTTGGAATIIPVTSCASTGEIQITGTYRWQ